MPMRRLRLSPCIPRPQETRWSGRQTVVPTSHQPRTQFSNFHSGKRGVCRNAGRRRLQRLSLAICEREGGHAHAKCQMLGLHTATGCTQMLGLHIAAGCAQILGLRIAAGAHKCWGCALQGARRCWGCALLHGAHKYWGCAHCRVRANANPADCRGARRHKCWGLGLRAVCGGRAIGRFCPNP